MRIYLDYNATTPPLPEAIDAMTAALTTDFGNASSVHAFGQRAKAIVDDARGAVASLIDADPSEIVFTGSGTEADNLALRGAAEALAPSGRRHIVTTGIEHEAVLNTCRALEKQGWRLTVLGAGSDGIVAADALRAVITRETALVSVMHANNETGAIQPVASLAAIAREHGAVFHTDAIQSAGKIPVSTRQLGADLLAISAHKFGGPKGAGALWVRRGVRLVATMTGGRQERSRRAGTENVPAIAGMGAAARVARVHLDAGPLVAARRDRLESGILTSVAGTAINGDRDRRVPNTTNISFDGVEAESLLIALDLEGVAVSTGSACSSGSLEPSHVLKAMGLPNARTRNALRFSLGARTTDAEIDAVIAVLPSLVGKLRQLGRTAAALR
ncbi:MAG TPA: cysteine desulfurase family protein [Vicinamibacterales bacterium]|nr:cysteine desulfurase family protein [Vicinamibacterales bacterium]